MRRIFYQLFHPGPKLLIAFGICVSLPLILFALSASSPYTWFADLLFYVILILLGFVFLVTFFIDRSNKTCLKRYVYVVAGLLALYSVISMFVQDFMKEKSESRGAELASYVRRYKDKNGFYPLSFDDEFFDDAPKRTLLFNRYGIDTYYSEKEKDTVCYIDFVWYDYWAALNLDSTKWHYHD